jgi:energy-coupling factor transporter ATP-binding protein EcfA2
VPQFSGGELRGSLSVLGHDPTRVQPHALAAAGVGLVFQNPVEGFVANRVAEEVAFGAENLGLPADEIDRRLAASLEAVDLVGFEDRRLRELSTGQQQRVALASALVLEPRLLCLDEPTAHLDVESARAVLELVGRLHAGRGLTVLLSEHRLGLAAPLAGRALVLVDGRVVADGPPRAVFGAPGLVEAGVPVPRATQAAIRLGLTNPPPLTPAELAAALRSPEPSATGPGATTPRHRPSGATPAAADHSRSPHIDEARAGHCPEAPAALRFERVSYAYAGGTQAVRDVSVALHPGEVAALVGPTGAGKTTLARLALGLLRPDAGQVWLGGRLTRATPFSQLAGLGGLVLQNPLYQLLAERVDDELRLGLRGLDEHEREARVAELLDRFQLGPLRGRHPLSLSEGQRRRVALAAVLARRPRVLVLDEPTLGQDERQRAALVAIVADLARAGGSVLAISHDPEFVNDACARALVLERGRLVADVGLDAPPGHLAGAGVPLADAPATLLALGEPGTARTVAELCAAAGR